MVAPHGYTLPAEIEAGVKQSLEEWRAADKIRRLWAGDATLWTGRDEGKWLGWLGIVDYQLAHTQHLAAVAEEVRRAGFRDALLLGMGGSSLCPEVMKRTFGRVAGFPELQVLDSTDPAQVRAFEQNVDPGNTLFIVSSKSGTTLEPNALKHYFFERVKEVLGANEAGRQFIAITDPGSPLERSARTDGFRHVFYGQPNIGGRYSALSDFGLVPAAIMGVDAQAILARAQEMARSCASGVPLERNPGVLLGTILGVAARHRRDKVTLVVSPGIAALGAWLEQLLAESTGKEGKGLIPVAEEELGAPEVYDKDRVFVHLRLDSQADPAQDSRVTALERAGQPVVRMALRDPYDLGKEYFRWEMATAVAGSILGIHPFDQPDVEASKIATREFTSAYERMSALPRETPFFQGNGVQLFADEANRVALIQSGGKALAGYLRAHLSRLREGDYFALLAYVEQNGAHTELLQAIRHAVRDSRRVATCLGFGPRFLHSTGQLYKGGPNTGVFLQVTCDDAADLPVPGQKVTFGVVKAAQARGDFQVLAQRGRRALRVHLRKDVAAGLAALRDVVVQALA